MRRLQNFLRSLVLGPRVLWLIVAVVACCLIWALWSRTEPVFRWTGGILQSAGVLTVAWGIRDTKARFRLPGYVTVGLRWLCDLLQALKAQQPITGTATNILGDVLLKARAFVWTPPPPANAPLQQRVDVAETNLTRLNEDFRAFETRISQDVERNAAAIDEEKLARARGDDEILAAIKDAQTGGLHVLAAGVVWLLLGLFLSTLSPELAHWLGH